MPNSYSQLIADFAAAGPRVRDVVKGLTHAQSITHPPAGPGKWSILELVIHLSDTDQIVVDRIKRVLAEDHPKLMGADEDAYIARLHPHVQSLEDAVLLLELGRRQLARTLEQLTDADFDRTGTHSSAGTVTVKGMLKSYTEHLDYHLKFAKGKREKMGWTS